MSEPATTLAGPVLVTPRLADVPTVVDVNSVSLAGFVSVVPSELAFAALPRTAPAGTDVSTATTRSKVAEPPTVSVETPQVTVPVPPMAGTVHPNGGPLVCVRDWNVVPAGRASVRMALWELLGPLLRIVRLKVMFWPAVAVAGAALMARRSAKACTVALVDELLLALLVSVSVVNA